MRTAALITVVLVAGGCAHTVGGRSEQTHTSAATSAAAPQAAAPAAGASISDVIAWVGAGHPADPARYHSASREGVITGLGDDIALTAAGGAVSCMTDSRHTGGALACLVKLTSPPPPPPTSYGQWQGGWADFDGTELQVGQSRADPGPFVNGNGPELATGDSLSFGDYRCRADQTSLFCVNYAHQSAARFGPGGIVPFGCLRPAPAPEGVGALFRC